MLTKALKPRGPALEDIFISYNREDQAVARIYADAFKREGLSVWWDTALRSGDAYDEVTEAALRNAKAVVVLWSPRSVISRWVRAEATVADRNGTLLPLMIEPCERPIMFELTQTADLIGWNGSADDTRWNGLVDDVQRLIGRERAPKPDPAPAPPAAPALALPDKPSVAVMPFVNLSGGEDQDYFADGMVVEIISALSLFQSLFVISSGSTLSYRGDPRSPSAIARELGVRYILQGSVRKAGNQVRIAVELIDEVALSPIWSQRFNGNLDDIFALQDEISNSVASQIEPSIIASEVRRTADQPTRNNSAYDLYLRGTQAYWEQWTKDSLARAADLFEQAAALDPYFALAHVYASSSLINWVLQGHADDPGPVMKRSAEFAQAALRSGQNDAEVLSLAAYTLFQCEAPQANIDALIERSLALNPGVSRCHYTAGYIHLYAGRSEPALAAYDMALRLDPRTPWRDAIIIGQAQALYQLGRYTEALPLYAHSEVAFPEVAQAIRRIAAACHARMGDLATARAMPGALDPISANEHFLISRYRDPAFRQALYDDIALLMDHAPT